MRRTTLFCSLPSLKLSLVIVSTEIWAHDHWSEDSKPKFRLDVQGAFCNQWKLNILNCDDFRFPWHLGRDGVAIPTTGRRSHPSTLVVPPRVHGMHSRGHTSRERTPVNRLRGQFWTSTCRSSFKPPPSGQRPERWPEWTRDAKRNARFPASEVRTPRNRRILLVFSCR